MMATALTGLTLLLVAIAVYTDVRWGKIFNALTAPGIVLGLILNSIRHGSAGLLFSLAGIGLGLGLFVLSCLLGRILGGGDVKLLIAVGALQGPLFLMWALFYAAIIGALLAIIVSLAHGILLHKLKSLLTSCYLRLACRVPMDIQEDEATGPRLPYAIAISCGTLAAFLVLQVY